MVLNDRWNILAALMLLACLQECQSCSPSNSRQTHSIVSESVFYQECLCEHFDGTLSIISWLDPSGREIAKLGPGTKSNVYTVNFHHGVSLHVQNFTKNMSGEYTCVAIHDGHEYVFVHTVEAYDPLYFINTDENQFIVKGENSKIKCEPMGKFTTVVYWYKEGEGRPLQTINSKKYELEKTGLVVKNVEDDDAGLYKCAVTVLDTADEVDKYIKVEVVTVPEIENVIMTSNNTRSVGDFLKMECIANGTPSPSFKWSKINKELQKEITNGSWYVEDNTIIFEKIQAEDRGTYVCTASNKGGHTLREVILEVFIPPVITEFPNINTVEGTETKLICKAYGRPAPKLKIEFEDAQKTMEQLLNTSWVIEQTEGNISLLTLIFSKINREHNGTYTCTASNTADTTTLKSHVNVYYKPKFNVTEETVYGWNGNTVTLSCEHTSNPPSSVIWRFNKSYIKEASSSVTIFDSFGHQYLNVTLGNHTSYGTYECFARNKYGESTKVIKLLQAYPPPSIRNVLIAKKTASTVTFNILGPETKPEVIGYMAEYDDSENYDLSNIHTNRTWAIDRPYKIVGLTPGTLYYFKFAAINEVGVGEWTDIIELTTPEKSVPESPTWPDDIQESKEDSKVIVLGDNPTSHTLVWQIPEQNGDPVDYFIVGYCRMRDEEFLLLDQCKEERVLTDNKLFIDNLEPNTTYRVELTAHNSEGNSPAAQMFFKTSGELAEPPIISAGGIIALVVLIVLLILLIADMLLLFWKKQGVIATLCLKKRKNTKNGPQERDKKGLLKDNEQARTDETMKKDNNGHKEFEYNKNTGLITGKHSAV